MQRHTYNGESPESEATFREAWISGLHHNHLSISAHDDSEMFVIKFKAFGTCPFLQVPMDEMSDRIVPSNQFPNHHLFNMRERLFNAATSEDKFAVAYNWLAANFGRSLSPPQSIIDIVAVTTSR